MYPKLFYKPTGELGINTANPEGTLDVNITKSNDVGINIKRDEFNSRFKMLIDPSGESVINMNNDTIIGTKGIKSKIPKLNVKSSLETKGAKSEFNLNNDDTTFNNYTNENVISGDTDTNGDIEVKGNITINNDFHIEKNPDEKQDIKLDFSLSDGFPFFLKNEKAVIESNEVRSTDSNTFKINVDSSPKDSVQIWSNNKMQHKFEGTGDSYHEGDMNCKDLAFLKDNKELNLNDFLFYPGFITMFYGSENDVPDNWSICDGRNGTPNLRDRFIMGAREDNLGKVGGQMTVYLTTDQIPSHTHPYQDSIWSEAFGKMRPRRWEVGMRGRRKNGTDHDNKQYGYVDVTSEGNFTGNASHENRPPYKTLYYIMKLPEK